MIVGKTLMVQIIMGKVSPMIEGLSWLKLD